MSLLPVAQAQARLIALARPLGGESLPLDQCAGRWLAEDVIARRNQPWADLSAMDGYAIRHADLPGPWRVTGESSAGGEMPPAVNAGETARIFTGAPLPPGADTVVMQEDVSRDGPLVQLSGGVTIRHHAHVRPAGSDFPAGDIVIVQGERLSAPHIALAAISGHDRLTVGRRPKIAIIPTGSELAAPGADVAPDRLPASNGLMLEAMLTALPCEIEQLGIVPDSLELMTEAFLRAQSADIVVTTGGASVGDHDLVRPALEAAGGAIDFWKIAIRPGKPLIAGTLGPAIMIGLPGNPVSAFATAVLFLMPVVRHLAGSPNPIPETQTARLGSCVGANGSPRDAYLRAVRTGDMVVPLEDQDSAGLRALTSSNCFLIRPAGAEPAEAGSPVPIICYP